MSGSSRILSAGIDNSLITPLFLPETCSGQETMLHTGPDHPLQLRVSEMLMRHRPDKLISDINPQDPCMVSGQDDRNSLAQVEIQG